MAGDWIKAEKATPRKPEILRLAKSLGVTPDHAFGLCFRFWAWCDDHLTNKFLEGVTPEMLDNTIGQNGFSQALIDVGWLTEFDAILSIPNFERHLSQSAKTRSLCAQRAGKYRKKTPRK